MIQFLKISLLFLISINIYSFEYKFKAKKNESISWSFQSLVTNQSIENNSGQYLIPASTLKVPSMVYALNTLGADFTFNTKIYYTGKIVNGTLKGSLVIVGDFDPYLKHPQILNMAMAVKRSGIMKIEGSLIIDRGAFKEKKIIADFGLHDQTYNPSYGSLNSEFNRHSLWRNKESYSSIIPELEVELEPSRDLLPTQKFSWKNTTNKESWKINSTESLKKRVDLPIRNSGLWTAKLLKYHLDSLGIEISGAIESGSPKDKKHIFTNKSLPLWNLVALTMEYSNNLLAESIAMRACLKKGVTPLTQKRCSQDIELLFNKETSSKSYFVNASGLSSKNLTNSKSMASFIKSFSQKNWDGHTLASLLSISGQSGWMRKRLQSPNYNMRVYAKTGSLDFINNIVGLVRAKSNKWYSFSIYNMNHKKRDLVDSKSKRHLKSLKIEAKKWRNTSLNKIDQLLQSFIDQN